MGNSSFPGREKRKNPMISASDAEFLPAASRGDRRSTASLSTPSSSPKRPRNAVDGPEALRGVCREVSAGATAGGRQPQANYWSFKSRTPRPGGPSPPPPPSAASRGSSPPSAEHRGAMSDSELPAAFCRTSRLRQSLPLARSSASQSKPHAPGMLFLQLGEETRRVHLTHELSSLDTLRALIVHVFPQRLSMATLRSPSTALLIKDENRNVFYELEDPRDVQDRCVIKIYCKEPVYGTYPGQRHNSPLQLANGEIRPLQREMVYTPQDSPPSRRLGGAAPPVSSSQHRSASSSPPQGLRTRLLYSGGRPTSYAGPAAHHHGVPLAHHSPHLPPPSPAFGTSPSAILERRDVKPDDEAGSHRGVMLLRADERGGGSIYVAPYSVGGEARLGLTGAPPSPLTSRSDPYGSLYRRGAGGTVCSLMDGGGGGGGLYRAGSGALYNDTYAPSMLSLRVAAPSSPQKIADAREAYASTLPSRGSPARAERRRDSMMSSVGADSPGARGLTSEQLCLLAAAAGGDGGEVRGDESETRGRMEVMEKQIASLTGLLQRVLSRAPQDHSPDKMESASDGSGTDPGPAKQKKAVTPSGPLALMPPPPLPPAADDAASQPLTVSRLQMHRHLLGLQQSTNTLRTQLSQLRDMQLENQDCVLALLRKTEAELNVLMQDAARAQEDPLQRQRLLVEEERLKYLNQEETLVHKLHDLERWVEELQQNKSSTPGLPVSQRDLRQKMQELKMLADKLGSLKSQFPGLQSKMRVVLRVEVEAVKFLKEEPHRLDALLQRCNNVGDTLGALRRQASEKEQQEEAGSGGPSQTSSALTLTDSDGRTALCAAEPPLSFRSRVGAEKSVNAHVSADVTLAAERDWAERRASLTQFSAQDINRLLEETQAELLKAIPDLDLAAKTVTKPAVPPKPQMAAASDLQSPGKVQLAAQKLNSMEAAATSQRGSVDVGVSRCRADKPAKSPPPPPPPRRSFPLPLGAGRGTADDGKSSKMEGSEAPVALLRPRRATPSDAARPASTPPGGLGDEQKEVLGGSTVAARLKHLESKEEVRALAGGQQQVFHF
ncbi:SRC kinase signaling inhibitor 1-like isoform X5 [Syngnathus scovelli]|uniref:SRC kinase signaling inhibitor 1-like isoform X5 n=1 Tax=Syngnathus scovelli TaxID=161590 RepID=UPI00210F6869|nr:SRC kinase signaling inhibitor 1-like isoform X5 [Syngnathus scovelli]XP_049615707.1 SRC kinase signaling inhibitor 1-like isoform X5 [Syngnathus scovelli]XP_049615708.1 SRC kinase signaling inhibitor 1-like isoform X5 [Syngnathus scovelli]